MNIIGTGLSGLMGSRIVELLTPVFSFTNLSLETGVDITDTVKMRSIIKKSTAPWVFHFAAKTDVDGCESDRDQKERGSAWIVNVEATANIADICKETGKHLLYLSTDYVFRGNQNEYTEADQPDPVGWYGITKYEGEKKVSKLGKLGLIIRTANPYRMIGPGKTDFVHKILSRLRNGQTVKSPTDSTMKATYVDDIADVIRKLVTGNAWGIYHAVGDDVLTPFDAAKKIAAVFDMDGGLVSPTTFSEFFAGRAPRPLHAALKNVKITHYGIAMSPFATGLAEVKKQEKEQKL